MTTQRNDEAAALIRQHTALEQLSRHLIPPTLMADSEARHRATVTIVFGLSMAFWAAAIFAPVYVALGSTRGAVIIVIAGLSCVFSVLSFKVHGSFQLAGNLLAAIVLTTLLVLSVFTGGFMAPAMIWLPAVPIIATLLCDWRTGLPWLIATAISALAVFFLTTGGAFPESDLIRSQRRVGIHLEPDWDHHLHDAALFGV